MTHFVLIHGGLHGGWCWERVVPLLEAAGHTAVAPNLPGMGGDPTPLRDVTLARNGDFVADVIRKQGKPVILVGHSMGGLSISEAAERVPERIIGLIYLTAELLPHGARMADQGGSEHHAEGLIVSPEGSSTTYKAAVAPKIFYNRTDPAIAARAAA